MLSGKHRTTSPTKPNGFMVCLVLRKPIPTMAEELLCRMHSLANYQSSVFISIVAINGCWREELVSIRNGLRLTQREISIHQVVIRLRKTFALFQNHFRR